MSTPTPRRRRSLADIQADYDRGDKAELETLMRAWRGIKALPPDDPRSLFMLGGFHGEPFRGQGTYDSAAWWGGYCQHGTVLFPTWHRAYLHRLERALQSVDGCSSVMLPFWDECSSFSQENGIPRALTDETFELDGERIVNPLRSFVLPMGIVDRVAQDNLPQPDPNAPNYSKPAGYETVRYPLSGLVGTPADQKTTADHNAGFPNYAANVKTLDANIMAWLTLPVVSGGVTRGLVVDKFTRCMDAPTYTLFSNTTSARAWNANHPNDLVVPLESAHNFIHLAVGGFDIPTYNASPILGANGDMGENDTAALDPIFYFHHCFIDYAFWTWQRRHGATQSLTIDQDDPGASYAQSQPPAGGNPGDMLTMTQGVDPLHPRRRELDDQRRLCRHRGAAGLRLRSGIARRVRRGGSGHGCGRPAAGHPRRGDRPVQGGRVVRRRGLPERRRRPAAGGGRRRLEPLDGVGVRELPNTPPRQC